MPWPKSWKPNSPNGLDWYLAMNARDFPKKNCAHCHNPGGWKEASNCDFDFRFETSLQDSHIAEKKDKIKRVLDNGEMPYLGVTVLHEEGVALVVEYLDSL